VPAHSGVSIQIYSGIAQFPCDSPASCKTRNCSTLETMVTTDEERIVDETRH